MASEENLVERSPEKTEFSETIQPSGPIRNRMTTKTAVVCAVGIFLVISTILAAFWYTNDLQNKKVERHELQVYTTDLYTIEHPESWVAYDVKAGDTQLQSILIIPPEAVPIVQQSTSTLLESSYSVKNNLEESGYAYITMGAAYVYAPYVPLEQRGEFFELLLRDSEEQSSENLQTHSDIVSIKGRLVVLSKYQTEERVIESATWFAKPDPHGRDKGAETILVGIEYNAPQENYDDTLMQLLIQSADDFIYQKYLEGVPIPQEINATGALSSDAVYNSTTSSIVGIAVPRNGQKVLLGDFVGLSMNEFSTILRVLDTHSNQITTLNVSPFKTEFEINSGDYNDQQVFSPDGTKILLHYDVGIKSPNEDLAGQEGFAVFDLETSNLYKLLPTTENKHVAGFRTENRIAGGYANLYGWISDQEIIYTCDTRPKQDRSDSNVIPYDDIFISFDEVSYCVIDIETLEHRVATENEMVLSTYSSEMLQQSTAPFFASQGPDCININSGQCLRVVNGSIYFETSDQTLVVAEGNYVGFLGWKSQSDIYLLLNENTINGQVSDLIKLNIPLTR